MRVAVLASGNGSNFEVIAKAFKKKQIKGELVWLFSDQPDAFVLKRAQRLGVPSCSFSPKEFPSKQAYEERLLQRLRENAVDLVVLAGYMRIIGGTLLESYPQQIVNIHPSLLPSFPGLHGIKDAFDYGVKVTGVTIHTIDAGVDTGPIIAQEAVCIEETDTLASLETKIHQVEHRLYPEVLAKITEKGPNKL